MKKLIVSCVTVLLGAITSASAYTQQPYQLVAPSVNLIDHASVSLAAGVLSPSVTDVSIGGSMGLAHTTSSFTGYFLNWPGSFLPTTFQGFGDQYRGMLYKTLLLKGEYTHSDDPMHWIYSIRVSDGSSTVDFKIESGNTFKPFNGDSYELVWTQGSGFTMTTPDGTQIIYPTSSTDLNNLLAGMSEIIHPNGFRISIKGGGGQTRDRYSVRTNAGWQLKYVYDYSGPANTWKNEIPKKIIAINNAVEYCEHNNSTEQTKQVDCSLVNKWPTAQYRYPTTQTNNFADGDYFGITDQNGGETRFYHKKHNVRSTCLPEDHYIPRIDQIVYPSGLKWTYTYTNDCTTTQDGGVFPRYVLGGYGVIKSSSSPNGEVGAGYTFGVPYYSGSTATRSFAQGDEYRFDLVQHRKPGFIEAKIYGKKSFTFNADQGNTWNFRTKTMSDLHTGDTYIYSYDDSYTTPRNNITQISKNGSLTKASYPSTCTSANRKYCNKPSTITDPKGHVTNFTYHPASGQIQSITKPADTRGIRAHTQYFYQQKYAKAKNSSGVLVQEDQPIWMLAEEYTCADSTYTGGVTSGACASGDGIQSKYYYEHNNLLLTKKTVFSVKDNKTLTTCYEYDIYGNQIGATEPKGSCN